MYSPQQDFQLEPAGRFSPPMASMGTPHTTVGAVPVTRNNRVFNSSNNYTIHQRQDSFGTASIAMSPPNVPSRHSMTFTDANQNWFGTSLDSTSSSFGQSPIFPGRDFIVSPSTSSGHLEGVNGQEEEEGQQKNLQEIFEKRRRRRESHNAVERKRRDNINERIHELCMLLPERLLETAPTTSNVMSVSAHQGGINARAINKGTILKLSVDHIKELREEVARCQHRMAELEQLIEAAKRGEMITDIKPMRDDCGLQRHHQNENHKAIYPQNNAQSVHLMGSDGRHHERIGSFQFQQQFGNMQIKGSDDNIQ
ncbi:hypothetical protein CLU79DRAFT_750778 [Phycomyces nitens]|nr:hypothetical protein CLU79DRAFT_750778 [Phycomyces nitens]